MDSIDLYRSMARQRAVELALAELWHRGLAPGEMHLGTGEEAVIAGVVGHRQPSDAFAIDHRPSTVMTAIGVEPRAILAECIGREDGLCRGRGGHMHLLAPDRLAAASGIVGAAAPTATGFALAATILRPGAVAVAFFGDGAANQGMVLESMNLASAWKLPVLFVCKDNGWAVVTRTATVTGGDLCQRAEGFGLVARELDGTDVLEVHRVAGELLQGMRDGAGPAFLRAHVPRLDGHLLGDVLVRMSRKPTEGVDTTKNLLGGLFGRGASMRDRAESVGTILGLLFDAATERRGGRNDPLVRARAALDAQHAEALDAIDREARDEAAAALAAVTEEEAA